MSITKVLVANRAEIARRVFRTCRDMGISTVAVFSEPDAGEPHTHEADEAVLLPGSSASETYLDVDAVLAAAKETGADAIHPGYGFLSENAHFAEVCRANNIEFISGVNEDLGATAVWGSQQTALEDSATFDGVLGMWYGKAPGVDRASDAIRHGVFAGTAHALRALKPDIRIIGVEPTGSANMTTSRKEGRPTDLDAVTTIADGLATRNTDTDVFELIDQVADDLRHAHHPEMLGLG